jgi:hypothetical protein
MGRTDFERDGSLEFDGVDGDHNRSASVARPLDRIDADSANPHDDDHVAWFDSGRIDG